VAEVKLDCLDKEFAYDLADEMQAATLIDLDDIASERILLEDLPE